MSVWFLSSGSCTRADWVQAAWHARLAVNETWPACQVQRSDVLRQALRLTPPRRRPHLAGLVQPVQHVGVLVQQEGAAALTQAQLQRLAVDALGHAVHGDATAHAGAVFQQVLRRAQGQRSVRKGVRAVGAVPTGACWR